MEYILKDTDALNVLRIIIKSWSIEEGDIIMLLNQFTSEEKNAFLSLCVHAAKANNVFADEEYEMLHAYCKEMGVEDFDANLADDLETVAQVFKLSTIKNKKIMLFELLGLLYSDGSYDGLEKEFLKNFLDTVGDIGQKDIDVFSKYISEYLELLKKIVASVEE